MPRISLILAILIIFLTACAIPETPTQTVLPQITATFTPTASQTPEPSATLTPNPTENAQAMLSANATNNAAHYETSVAEMTAIALVKPTITPTLTPTSFSLINREPQPQEVGNYLKIAIGWVDISPVDDDPPVLFYEDMTGDGKSELIAFSPAWVVVLEWAENRYSIVYNFRARLSPRGWPNSQVAFEDWTADGIPEIVLDNGILEGGSDLSIWKVTRYVVHCESDRCTLVWDEVISIDSDMEVVSTMERYRLSPNIVKNQESLPEIRAISENFGLYTYMGNLTLARSNEVIDASILKVYTSTLSIYTWTGSAFELSEKQIVSLPYSIESDQNLSAKNKKNVLATVAFQLSDEVFPVVDDECNAFIDGKSIGNYFPCKHDFTKIDWQDITGDGIAEAIISTLFTTDPMTFWADCAVQQRLLAYTWDGQTATLIADASGCVTRPEDLYGVRLEDYDGDGLPEIIAAQLDADNPERIYKFNGTEFVFWSEIPQK